MSRYIVRRLGYLVPVWLGISLLAYGLANLAPGDPAYIMLRRQTGEAPSDEAVQALRVVAAVGPAGWAVGTGAEQATAQTIDSSAIKPTLPPMRKPPVAASVSA